MATQLLHTGPTDAAHTLVLAHGAGAPMDSPFLVAMAVGLAERGIRVVRFEFPYMAARRVGKGGPPDREKVLRATWHEVVEALGGGANVAIGGKSMGGRIASMVADELGVRGLVCLGYPFHPPKQPEKLRVAHLEHLATPALIVQGERDPFGTRDEIPTFKLSPAIQVAYLGDGDHSFEPRKKSGRTTEQAWAEAIELIAAFLEQRASA
jgi:predicted alpha/beta-hydrolase family hydrolase